jgi:hypothetical protein
MAPDTANNGNDHTEAELPNQHLLGGLIMGGLSVVIGVAWVLGALRRRRDRAATGPTYTATGGVVYTIFQLGCAGLLIVGGIAILGLMLAGGPS